MVNASLGTSSPTTFDAGTLASEETVANLDLLHKLESKLLDLEERLEDANRGLNR